MKLIDAIRNVIRPEPKSDWHFAVDEDSVNSSLNITEIYDYPRELMVRFKAYPIFNWNCTDTHVGLDALYMDGEPVGCSFKPARKSDAEVKWISEEIAEKVRKIILSFADKPAVDILDPDEDIGEDFSVQYSSEALTDEGFFEGRPVRALIWYDTDPSTPEQYRQEGRSYIENVEYKDLRNNCVKILDNGIESVIPNDDFRMAFNVRSEDANRSTCPRNR